MSCNSSVIILIGVIIGFLLLLEALWGILSIIYSSGWYEKRKQKKIERRIKSQVKAIKQYQHTDAPYCQPFNSDSFKTTDKEIDDGHKNFDYE